MATRSGSGSRWCAAVLVLLAGAGPASAQTEAVRQLAPAAAPAGARILLARKVLTMEPANPEATAVAVSGKRIVAVGSLAEVKAALGDVPYTVDETFQGKVLLPGFIDQHLHPILGALTLAIEVIAPEEWALPGRTYPAAGTPAEYLARLRAAEARLPGPQDWLLTWGYHPLWHGKLDRAALDAVSATRPIAIWQRSCHEFYLNTAALAALGITEEMTVGKGLASTQASWKEGHFYEAGLNLIMAPMLKVLATPERMAFGLRQMVAYLHARGVTAFNEPGALVTPESWKLYQAVLGADATPMYSTFIADGRGIPDRVGMDKALQATEAQIAMAPLGSGGKLMFFPKQVKLFADGAIISQLMQMKDGYLDGHQGQWIMPPEMLEERARLYWNAGYQLHTHVNGDQGLEVLLDVLERRMREAPRADHRAVIVHMANATEAQIARIARLGAVVSVNPYYPVGFADRYGKVGLGPARADAMARSGSVLRHHVPLSLHSDLPMAVADPLALASYAVNRTTPSGRVAGPEERIGVQEALRAITIEAAWSWRMEAELGSIAPGKVANFTVLEQDPLGVPKARLAEVPVWGTVFEGRPFPAPPRSRGAASAPAPDAPLAPGLHAGHENHGDDGCLVARLLLAALQEAEGKAGGAAAR